MRVVSKLEIPSNFSNSEMDINCDIALVQVHLNIISQKADN